MIMACSFRFIEATRAADQRASNTKAYYTSSSLPTQTVEARRRANLFIRYSSEHKT
jgi:hypothetical protein